MSLGESDLRMEQTVHLAMNKASYMKDLINIQTTLVGRGEVVIA